jgi:SAM-dependent methyltransferase
MDFIDLVKRTSPPVPWAEGDNIPWHEPDFSLRMLKEHLSQAHDAASRRFEIIDRQVDWIHTTLLVRQPSRILDLGCGPGLYAQCLARLGHSIYGIDYSPASIEYAIKTASQEGLTCTYTCEDIRQAIFPHQINLVMLIFGEFNVFRPSDAQVILGKAWHALEPGGILLLEPHPFEVVQRMGEASASWYSSPGGLFSDRPYVVLQENFWDAGSKATTIRYYILEAHSGQISHYAQSFQAYQDDDYRSLLSAHGFSAIQILQGLLAEASQKDLMAIIARKLSKP